MSSDTPSPSSQPSSTQNKTTFVRERRQTVSELEHASETLAHAVNYLVLEQLEGRRGSLPANREAIALLCEAGRSLEKAERRTSSRASIASWLRGASRARAISKTAPRD